MTKQLVIMAVMILISLLQARRKAANERKKQAEALPVPLGAVGDDDDVRLTDRQSRVSSSAGSWQEQTSEADRFLTEIKATVPSDIRTSAIPNSRRAWSGAFPIEPLVLDRTEISEPLPASAPENAYEITTTTRRGISFDKESMRTFLVAREVLGPPRSRRPFRFTTNGRA